MPHFLAAFLLEIKSQLFMPLSPRSRYGQRQMLGRMCGQEADILQKTGEFGRCKLPIEDTLIEAIVSFEGPEVILNVLSQILIDKHRVILPAKEGGLLRRAEQASIHLESRQCIFLFHEATPD
jgi:hypothetical protein